MKESNLQLFKGLRVHISKRKIYPQETRDSASKIRITMTSDEGCRSFSSLFTDT